MGLNIWTNPRITFSFDGDRDEAKALERRARCLTGYVSNSMGARQSLKQMTFHDRNGSLIQVRVTQGVFGKQAQVRVFVEPQEQGWCEYTDALVLGYMKDGVLTPGLIYRCENCFDAQGKPLRARLVCEKTTEWDGISDDPIIDHVQFERKAVIYTQYDCSFPLRPEVYANPSGVGGSVMFASSKSEVYIIHHGGNDGDGDQLSETVEDDDIFDIGIVAEGRIDEIKVKSFAPYANTWFEVYWDGEKFDWFPDQAYCELWGIPYKKRGRRINLESGKITWIGLSGNFPVYPGESFGHLNIAMKFIPCFRVEESDGTVYAAFYLGDITDYARTQEYPLEHFPPVADINRDDLLDENDYFYTDGIVHRFSMWQISP